MHTETKRDDRMKNKRYAERGPLALALGVGWLAVTSVADRSKTVREPEGLRAELDAARLHPRLPSPFEPLRRRPPSPADIYPDLDYGLDLYQPLAGPRGRVVAATPQFEPVLGPPHQRRDIYRDLIVEAGAEVNP